jgi:hypothetical protein
MIEKPVIFYRCNGCGHAYEQVHPTSCDCMEAGGFDRVEYFTAPAAQRQWVGLTVSDWDEISDMPDSFDQGVVWAVRKLKEKNT